MPLRSLTEDGDGDWRGRQDADMRRKPKPTVSGALKVALDADQLSWRVIVKIAAIPEASLMRFVKGESSLSLDEADRVADFLGLELVKGKARIESEAIGGSVEIDDRLPERPVVSVDFRGYEATDANLEHLRRFTHLKTLDLYRARITDAGLKHLEGLTRLKVLDLSRANITDAGLVHLRNLERLQKLNLDSTRVTDAGLPHLAALPQLQWLNLKATDITESGLRWLKGSRRLRGLMLRTKALPNVLITH